MPGPWGPRPAETHGLLPFGMAKDRNPSGLPRQRIVRPMWGPDEVDVDRRVGLQHGGLVRVRRTLLVVAGFLVALVVVVAVGGGDAAWGIAALWLAPLLIILAVLQVLLLVTRPKATHDEPDDPGGTSR